MDQSLDKDKMKPRSEVSPQTTSEPQLLRTHAECDFIDMECLDRCAKAGTATIIATRNGPLVPTIMAADETGRVEICDLSGPVELMPKLIRVVLKSTDARMYAVSLQTWGTEFVEKARDYDYEIQNMPLDDRQDFANIFVVDRVDGFVRHSLAPIEYLSGQKRRLKDWIDVTTEGMVLPFLVKDW